jgi:membrane-associated phospholipid phosphatase
MTALRGWLLALVLVVPTIVVSFFWLDRPLALFVHSQLSHGGRTLSEPLTHIPDPLIWLAAVTFVALGLWNLAGRPLSKLQAAILACSDSLMVAETIKNELKFVFGRTWPETWHQNNPSFIHDGIYGFNWFHGGDAYQSFPSGHMTAICAVASVLWIYYPRFRVIYVTVALVVLIGLVGANFHFLSDTIAGAFVGSTIGLMSTQLFDGTLFRKYESV